MPDIMTQVYLLYKFVLNLQLTIFRPAVDARGKANENRVDSYFAGTFTVNASLLEQKYVGRPGFRAVQVFSRSTVRKWGTVPIIFNNFIQIIYIIKQVCGSTALFQNQDEVLPNLKHEKILPAEIEIYRQLSCKISYKRWTPNSNVGAGAVKMQTCSGAVP